MGSIILPGIEYICCICLSLTILFLLLCSMWDVLADYYIGDIIEAEHREVIVGTGLGQ